MEEEVQSFERDFDMELESFGEEPKQYIIPKRKSTKTRKDKLTNYKFEQEFQHILHTSVFPQVETEYSVEAVAAETEDDDDSPTTILEETIDWPQKDFQQLVSRIEYILPKQDNLAFGTRIEKLDWNEISFNDYSGYTCKRAWLVMQKKIRKYRLLTELLQDAKTLVTNSYKTLLPDKNKRHPDMPKRPMSAYLIYYMKKKHKMVTKNPGVESSEVLKKIRLMFKNLSESKRDKYVQLAAEERKKYDIKLEEFYRRHPEIYRTTCTSSKSIGTAPKKPPTPFSLYFEHELKTSARETDDCYSFKEKCREQWKNLPDKQRLVWIDCALDSESKYQEELKKYVLLNPTYSPSVDKPVLNKEEKLLKDKLMMIQSKDIKQIETKYRFAAIAEQWKTTSDEDKQIFKDQADTSMGKYQSAYSKYLSALTCDKRNLELDQLMQRKQPTTNRIAMQLKKNLKLPQSDDGPNPKKRKSDISNENSNPQIISPLEESKLVEPSEESDVAPPDVEPNMLPSTENDSTPIDTSPAPTTVEDTNVVSEEPIANIDESVKTDEKIPENKKKTKRARKPKKEEKQKTITVAARKKMERELLKAFDAEPPSPPISAMDLFKTRYHGRASLEVAWRKLSTEDKDEYQLELSSMKQKYIKEYEEFLKGLTKEQLAVYAELKKRERLAKLQAANDE